jgi:Domain of unknown function (DUF4426)
MTRRATRPMAPFLACVFAALAGCGQGEPVQGTAQTAAPSEPTTSDLGEFQLHYNAVRTDLLAPEVARAYGIERSTNRVMLNVSLLHKNADGTTSPADGKVTATAYNLTGQTKDLTMRRITEGSSVYYIGEVGISGDEILVFNIDVVPPGQNTKHTVQFKREFFSD